MHRFFVNAAFADRPVRITGKDLHHLHAARIKAGQTVELFNDKKEIRLARIEKVTSSFALAHLLPSARQNLVSTAQASRYGNRLLAVPMPDEASRSDWLVEKAVELGATDIVPLITQRSATAKNMARWERWKRVVQSATTQSLTPRVPTLHPSTSLEETISSLDSQTLILWACMPSASKYNPISLLDVPYHSPRPLALFVGPEGDFSESEKQLFVDKKGVPVILSYNTRLRVETAAITLLSVTGLMWNKADKDHGSK